MIVHETDRIVVGHRVGRRLRPWYWAAYEEPGGWCIAWGWTFTAESAYRSAARTIRRERVKP